MLNKFKPGDRVYNNIEKFPVDISRSHRERHTDGWVLPIGWYVVSSVDTIDNFLIYIKLLNDPNKVGYAAIYYSPRRFTKKSVWNKPNIKT